MSGTTHFRNDYLFFYLYLYMYVCSTHINCIQKKIAIIYAYTNGRRIHLTHRWKIYTCQNPKKKEKLKKKKIECVCRHPGKWCSSHITKIANKKKKEKKSSNTNS